MQNHKNICFPGNTVYSEMFVRVLAAKFREIKTLTKWLNHSVSDVSKSCPSPKF